jgi:hypothetical protein
MSVESCFSLLSSVLFIKLDPFFFVIAFGGVKGLGMDGVKLVLKGGFSFVKIHFGQFIKLRIHFFMNVLNQLTIHHRFGQKLVVKFFL